jgi:superfamily II DNA or RNA helicase
MAIDKNTVIITNKAWYPLHQVDMNKVRKNYLIYRYEEKGCVKCEYSDERVDGAPHYICETCQCFQGKYKLYEQKTIDGKKYIGLHVGDRMNHVKKAGMRPAVLDNIDDQRARPKLKYEIKFTGKLRDHQKDAMKQWFEFKFGQLMAPPRSGKTILAVKFTLRLGLKTLILVHQGDLLDQMLQSFYDFTNIKDVEFEHKKQLIGIAKKAEDFTKWPIVLSTYQKFISPKGKLRLQKVKRKFGLVIVDEVHRSAADCFSLVMSQFEAKHRLGFTATPKRKDRKEFLSEQIIGPVTSKVEPDQVIPKVYVHLSGVSPRYEYKTWVPAMQFLARDKKRMKMIADLAYADVLAGHSVIIPVTFVQHAKDLAAMIDKMLYKKYDRKNLAIAFTAKVKDRKEVLEQIRKGKVKVVVGIRSLIQAGINVPRWSSLIEICPISNVPNHTQETARVRTPMDGKPQPIIRHVVDENMGMATGCFCTCFQVYKTFEWDQTSYEKAMGILKNSRRGRMGIEDKYDTDAVKPTRLVGFDSKNKSAEKKEPAKPRGVGFGGLNPKSVRG